MSDEPYRAGRSGPSDELARLAREGQARLRSGARSPDLLVTAAAERNMRVAIGPVRGAPLKRAVLALVALCAAGLIGHNLLSGARTITFAGTTGVVLAGWLLPLYMLLPPLSSRAALEAERAWVASLPFALEGYFDVIGAPPEIRCRLRVELWWEGPGVDPETLQGVAALFDTEARLIEVKSGYASLTSGPISGRIIARARRSNILRNHRFGKVVHRLVDVFLLPIHRSAPLARVTLSRSY